MNATAQPGTTWRVQAIITLFFTMFFVVGFSSPVVAQTQFTADKDHAISLDAAVLYTTSFQQVDASGVLKAEAFGKDAIVKLLEQPGCVGMRIYYGTGEAGRRVLVLVGVDVDGKDMYLGVLDEKGFPCPPICDESSPLNGN